MLHLKDYKLFENEGPHSYGCSMVYFDLPFMEMLHKCIDEKDIYEEEEDKSYGLEKDPHVTLLYGIHDKETDTATVLEMSVPKTVEEIKLHGISFFESEKYDVLKFDADAKWLHAANKKLTGLPHTNKFPDYHPHATIGYLKKGSCKKYVDMLTGIEIKVTPDKIVYSKAGGEKKEKVLKVDEAS